MVEHRGMEMNRSGTFQSPHNMMPNQQLAMINNPPSNLNSGYRNFGALES